jgi:hypothetical protein
MKYALVLNDMRSPNVENISTVKMSQDKQELIDWYNSQLTDPWKDGRWGKSFKKDSQLEWYNPVHDITRENDYWGGIYTFDDDVTDESILNFGLYK